MRRIIVTAVVVATAMFAIADGRVLAQAGLLGTCTTVAAPAGDDATWESCVRGRVEGHPDLTKRSCTRQGVTGDAEVWRCPAPVTASRN